MDHIEGAVAFEFDGAGADVGSAEVHCEKRPCFFACGDVGDYTFEVRVTLRDGDRASIAGG